MTPPLIAWEDVPEGPVWFRLIDRPHADYINGTKRYGFLLVPGITGPHPTAGYEFARAEQQPGEHDRELEIAQDDAEHFDVCRQQAEADLARLKAGIAALEQDMTDRFIAEVPPSFTTLNKWLKGLAALREGR